MAESVSGMTGALQGTVGGVVNKGQAWIDSIFPPEKRNELMAKISKFATEKPMLASFIGSQIALTGFPLGLFMVMTISVVIVAILAGLIIGLLGAVLFIVFAVGFALIILLPTLFIAASIATFIWLWGMGAYYIVKKFNQKKIPGIHTDFKEGVSDSIKGQLSGITGEGGPQGDPNGAPKEEKEEKEEKEAKHNTDGPPKLEKRSDGASKAINGAADKSKEAADVGKHAGKVQNAAGGATNAAGGAKGAVSGTVGI